jgi:OOP family OmpA-OmpF porin
MERRDDQWAAARAVGAPFDSPFNEHSPTVAAGMLCFNSSRPDGFGRNDIYCGPLDGTPTHISTLNSAAQDAGPWLAGQADVLLFTSNREGGEGGWDLYVATRTADGWSAPRNLGAPINTAADELWPTWTDGQLYFKRTGGTDQPGYFSIPLSLRR